MRRRPLCLRREIQYLSHLGTFYFYKFLPYFTCVNCLCDAAALLRVLALRRLEMLRYVGRLNGQSGCRFGRE
jgi:hypothetical protein